jgi:carboxyl-terminal processing protease
MRTQKSLSLNLAKRKAERTTFEAERLARENKRRAGRGLPPVATLEEIDEQEELDAILTEAAQIAADLDLAEPGAARAASTGPGTRGS